MRHWLAGITPLMQRRQAHGDNLIWRNQYMDGYKIGDTYQDKPMDLSNYLLIRTREKMMLQGRVSG